MDGKAGIRAVLKIERELGEKELKTIDARRASKTGLHELSTANK